MTFVFHLLSVFFQFNIFINEHLHLSFSVLNVLHVKFIASLLFLIRVEPFLIYLCFLWYTQIITWQIEHIYMYMYILLCDYDTLNLRTNKTHVHTQKTHSIKSIHSVYPFARLIIDFKKLFQVLLPTRQIKSAFNLWWCISVLWISI